MLDYVCSSHELVIKFVRKVFAAYNKYKKRYELFFYIFCQFFSDELCVIEVLCTYLLKKIFFSQILKRKRRKFIDALFFVKLNPLESRVSRRMHKFSSYNVSVNAFDVFY